MPIPISGTAKVGNETFNVTAEVTLPPSRPDETNTGAGLLRPLTKTITSKMTYSTPGQVIKDTIFENFVSVTAANVTFENCWFRGPQAAPTNNATLVNTTKGPNALFRYCTFNPQTVSAYMNGIGYKNFTLENCWIKRCVDNCSIFAMKDDPDPAVHVVIRWSWLDKMVQFRPDVANNNRSHTHNDDVQLQGNVGPADDVLIEDSRLDAYHDIEASPLPPEHTHLAAVMLTPNVNQCQDRVSITMRRCWVSGGLYTFNAGSDYVGSNSVVVLEDNIWEKPSSGGVQIAIAIDSSLTQRTIKGNVYTDGTPVPTRNA